MDAGNRPTGWPRAVVIVTYTAATGPSGRLATFLADGGTHVLLIRHPLPGYFQSDGIGGVLGSEAIRVSPDGEECLARIEALERLPLFLRLICHFILSVAWILWYARGATIAVGAGNINAVAASVSRSLGAVDRVVFFAIDFAPIRFGSYALDHLYLLIEWLASVSCNVVWNLSPAMPIARRERINLPWRWAAPDLVVPMGAHLLHANLADVLLHRATYPLVGYMGVLNPNSGVDLLIEAMRFVQEEIIDAKLIVIGTGSENKKLVKMCSKYLNNKSFVFTGFIDDHRKLEEMLAGAWVGVAPYRDDVSSFSRYADPGKVKAYLCLGLPVVMTSVPPIAKAIGAQECGIVTAADARDLADAIILLLREADVRASMELRAFQFGTTFSWPRVFEKALNETFEAQSA